ncbi:uncharacterized protein LOC133520995 [Cydia pomonella]|uniref:uncharacterized protein LOC133520995 n=1 Tax=Cydia pomonella TaxID=82600 RepID=UPI002ADDA527|nr:uncharacterized protein LOC133520995 [Cydia pomonella]
MSPLKIINTIIIVENVMGIFRNYLFFKPEFKKLANLYIVLIMCVNIYGCTLFYQTSLLVMKFKTNDRNMNIYSLIYYNFASITICTAAIILAVFNRHSFKTYVNSVFTIYKLCKNDIIYQNSMNKLKKRVLIVSSLSVVLLIFRSICYFLIYLKSKFLFDHDVNFSVVVFIDLTLQYRYVIESVTFYILCDVVVFCLQYLSCSVRMSKVKLNHEDLGNGDFLKLEDNLKKWGVVSRQLLICVNQLSSSFGFLVIFFSNQSIICFSSHLLTSFITLLNGVIVTPAYCDVVRNIMASGAIDFLKY